MYVPLFDGDFPFCSSIPYSFVVAVATVFVSFFPVDVFLFVWFALTVNVPLPQAFVRETALLKFTLVPSPFVSVSTLSATAAPMIAAVCTREADRPALRALCCAFLMYLMTFSSSWFSVTVQLMGCLYTLGKLTPVICSVMMVL